MSLPLSALFPRADRAGLGGGPPSSTAHSRTPRSGPGNAHCTPHQADSVKWLSLTKPFNAGKRRGPGVPWARCLEAEFAEVQSELKSRAPRPRPTPAQAVRPFPACVCVALPAEPTWPGHSTGHQRPRGITQHHKHYATAGGNLWVLPGSYYHKNLKIKSTMTGILDKACTFL